MRVDFLRHGAVTKGRAVHLDIPALLTERGALEDTRANRRMLARAAIRTLPRVCRQFGVQAIVIAHVNGLPDHMRRLE